MTLIKDDYDFYPYKILKDISNCNNVTIHETNTVFFLDYQDIHSNDMIWIDKYLQTFS